MDLFWENLSDDRFQKAIQFLYNLQYSGIKLGLFNIQKFLQLIGNPHLHHRYIHVAGTNGKGSTIAIMEAALMENGYTVGVFTSPHLISFQERIRINQQIIPVSSIIDFIENYHREISRFHLTFFEASTAMAFWYFNQHQPDFILLETGLGGRLDSTNVVHANLTAITTIDFDHTQYLGNTLSDIAAEKACIIHQQSKTYTNNVHPDVVQQIMDRCNEMNASYFNTAELTEIFLKRLTYEGMQFSFRLPRKELFYEHLTTPLIGKAQLANHQLALSLLLNEELIPMDETFMNRALRRIIWPGRLQKIASKPTVILDVGHNPAGFATSLKTLSESSKGELMVVCGIVNDKDTASIAKLLEQYSNHIHLVSFSSGRTLPPQTFATYFSHPEKIDIEEDTAREVVNHIKTSCAPEDIILVIGSHYLIGEYLEQELKTNPHHDFYYTIPTD